jgi:RimJ/RimL family protein N-acetyltransferase
MSDQVVVLRDIVDDDSEAIYEYLTTDRDISRWTRIPWPYTRSHLADFMALVGRARPGRTDLVLAISEAPDDRLLGCIGIHRIGASVVPRSAMLPNEIGNWIGPEARGRGLVTRAVRMLSAYALSDLGIDCINLQTKDGNVASQHVARNAGYRHVALVTAADVDDDPNDHNRFEMTRADYERANGPLPDATLSGASGSASAP